MKKETAKDGLCTDVSPPSEKNRGSGDVCTQAKLRNDLPVTGDLCYAHRILGSPGSKHCKSVEDDRNVRGTQRLFSVKYRFGEANIA